MARIAGGSSDIERKVERKVREPQVANDPPWSYIIDDDKKQDAPIEILDDEDDDVVIISETHTPKGRLPTVAASPNDCLWVPKATTRSESGKETTTFSFQKTYHTVFKRRRSNGTDFELTNFGFTQPRDTKICRMTRDEVPPLLTKISYTNYSWRSSRGTRTIRLQAHNFKPVFLYEYQQQTSERAEFATVTQGLFNVIVTLISTPGLAQILEILMSVPGSSARNSTSGLSSGAGEMRLEEDSDTDMLDIKKELKDQLIVFV
ncbi:hypothetical protein VTO58DRAFT_103310 [Aureobasidium pullulans]